MKNYTIIIFGSTGDLTKRKLIPVIISLAKKNVDFNFTILGLGRTTHTNETFKKHLFENLNFPQNVTIHYLIADLEKGEMLDSLKNKLESIEPENTVGRIFYLATSYNLFKRIAEHINYCESKNNESMFTRIIAEKPFGNNLDSSRAIDKYLKIFFSEEQIYRADHYLAKETIDNILKLRLSNPLFENIWNAKFISKIKVVVDEELGVGNRLGYYDTAGAIKDMVQNHLLQTASLVLMEPPKSLDDNDFKKAKINAIKKLKFRNNIITGQYSGYQDEVQNINPGSSTETFVELMLYSTSTRWKNVPIVLRTGKKLKKRGAYIEIEFKKEPCMIYCHIGSSPNKLIIHIQPKNDIELTINTTAIGEDAEQLTPVKMSFSPISEFNANSAEAYEIILKECLLGNKRIFMHSKEIEAAWILTDKIVEFVKNIKPVIYDVGSEGPKRIK